MSGLILGTGQLDIDLLGPVASGSSNFGSLSASANSEVENLVVASALLGEVTATAAAVRQTFATATSSFGALVAEANTIPVPPTPPTPEFSISQSGSPAFVQPFFPPVEQIKVEPIIATAMAQATLPSFTANAVARIDFSIIDDDNEVLLLL
jgi:hypothetical protein